MSHRRRATAAVLFGAFLLAACAGVELTSMPIPLPAIQATLGDTWTRPADGMDMFFVSGGTFQKGSSQDQTDAALVMPHFSQKTPDLTPCRKWAILRPCGSAERSIRNPPQSMCVNLGKPVHTRGGFRVSKGGVASKGKC